MSENFVPSKEQADPANEAARNEAWGVTPDTFVDGNDYLARRPEFSESASVDEVVFESSQEEGDVFSGKSLREIADIAHNALIDDDRSTAEEAKEVLFARIYKLVEEGKIDDDTAQSRLLYLESVMYGEVEASRSEDSETSSETEAEAENHTFSPDDHLEASRQAAANHENIPPRGFEAEGAAQQELTDQDHANAAHEATVKEAENTAKEAAESAQRQTAGEVRDEAAAAGQDVELTSSDADVEDVPADDTDTAPIEATQDAAPVAAKKGFLGKVKQFFKFGKRASHVKRIQRDRARIEGYSPETRAVFDKANELLAAEGKKPLRKAPGRLFPNDRDVKAWNEAKESLEAARTTPETKPISSVPGVGEEASSPMDTEATVVVNTDQETDK